MILGTASVLFERRTLLQRLLPVELRVRQQPHALLPSARHGLRLVHLPRTRGAARCSALGSASDDSAAPWRGHQNFCCGQCNCCQQGQLCSFDGACTQNVLQTVITVSVLVSVGSFLTMIFVPIVTRLYLVRHYNARTSCDHRALLAAWHPPPLTHAPVCTRGVGVGLPDTPLLLSMSGVLLVVRRRAPCGAIGAGRRTDPRGSLRRAR